MAKRKTAGRKAARKSPGKSAGSRRATRRTAAVKRASRKAPKRPARRPAKRAATKARPPAAKAVQKARKSTPKSKPVVSRPKPGAVAAKPRTPAIKPSRVAPARLTRQRRVLDDSIVQSPPSSLDMDRHGSAARTGRAEMAEHLADHATLTPSITAGDVDVNIEDAYFVGDEAPGGDNSTPDQDIVDNIGKALGVEYEDNEELKSADKLVERDKHRWELDPASAEDYPGRDKE